MKVSIITIVYNNDNHIASCIESVLEQEYEEIEHIIIDGGSTDDTLKVIKKYKDNLAYFISERDEGLYNALNKGIRQATGDVVGILHSDDNFFNERSVTKIVNAFKEKEADLVYAKGIFVDKGDINKVIRTYPSNPYKSSLIKYGWIPLHTTIFVKREIFDKYGLYREDFKIAGDYEISLRWFTNDTIKKHYLDKWLVKMRIGGKSTTPKFQKLKSAEDLQIIKEYDLPGNFTLGFKILRKIPHYIIPRVKRPKL
ncbi:MAG: glycosyltransferase family 2 protein [Leeuwenhoekiella sp.]